VRYSHLIARVREAQPSAIIEIGTWNGDRARQMLEAAPEARYVGFDLFDSATPATDAVEFNVKPHHSIADVYARLGECGKRATLIKGNTRHTLAEYEGGPFDFAWIDGGHSVHTIASDWHYVSKMLAPNAEVWLDDYYTGGPDIGLVGCNAVVRDLQHELHPAMDRLSGSGYVQMVRVWPT
jgi:predicted O-methyltransferase YrrM